MPGMQGGNGEGEMKFVTLEDVIERLQYWSGGYDYVDVPTDYAVEQMENLPMFELVRCRECKHWRQQTNYVGAPLSFGFCESDDMWRSLYGETCEVEHIDTEDDFYCGFAERREDG